MAKPDGPVLRAREWEVRTIPLADARKLVEEYHYARGGSNTATYRHGLFRVGEDVCMGAAWWIPPTKSSALVTYPANWQGVLALSRLVIHPDAPKNAASFLLAQSRRMVDRSRFPALVTYADEWRGHTGAIYRADNWTYEGRTKPERTYQLEGVMVSRKRGPKTLKHAEMLALGAELVGAFAKHKFTHIEVAIREIKENHSASAD